MKRKEGKRKWESEGKMKEGNERKKEREKSEGEEKI